ncbi:serine kinase [candidate division WOR-3 bacterium]|nr:serine kinase [candidate division WOR-3 bacterium]
MKLTEIVKSFNLQVACGEKQLEKEVSGGYSSDRLSDVMANSNKGDIWITLQVHPNVVAVAMLKEIAGIVMINGRKPEDETIKKAEAEGLPIMTTDLPAFELAGKLYDMGIRGTH